VRQAAQRELFSPCIPIFMIRKTQPSGYGSGALNLAGI
jgi:hypothetical protein